MPKILGAIPARYPSRRFPGKPLAKIGDKIMLQWVWEASCSCKDLDHVVVATDDDRIYKAVKDFGGDVVMTSDTHTSGTDRLAELASKFPEYDILVNIQGDEPGIDHTLISGVVRMKVKHPEWEVTTAAHPLTKEKDPLLPERVKLVMSKSCKALYFSRSLIPFPRNKTDNLIYIHLGIYAYQRAFLMHLHTLPESNLEKVEALEQLRVIENDFSIGVHIIEDALPPVDTPEDLEKIRAIFKQKKTNS